MYDHHHGIEKELEAAKVKLHTRSWLKGRIGQLNNLTETHGGPANRHWICHHHVIESDSKFAKTPLKESASKYGGLTPLKDTGNKWELWAAALRSAAMNSLDWDGGISSKNA